MLCLNWPSVKENNSFLGAKYYHTALVRSICCRGNQNNELTKLNHPYCLSHPCVGRTTNSQIATIDLDREQQPLLAWNWKHLDPQVEIVDPTTGKLDFLIKKNFFVYYLVVSTQFPLEFNKIFL